MSAWVSFYLTGEFKMKKTRNYHIAILSVFIAIILIQNFVPILGYIPVGPLSITLIPITVIVAALVLGLKDGVILGTLWGAIVFIRAFTWPTSPIAPLVFENPITAILPRALIPVVAYFAYKWLKKIMNHRISLIVACALGSMTNTILVLLFIYIFNRKQAPILYHVSVDKIIYALLGIVGTNGLVEMVITAVICPLIIISLNKVIQK